MKDILIQVAQHIVLIHCKSEKLMRWLEEYFQPAPLALRTSDVEIQIDDKYGISFQNYHVEITSTFDKITYRRADYQIEVTHDYRKAKIKVFDELALKHALTNLYSAFIIHAGWGLLIHSSCMEVQEKAHLFAGQSGAGKSTVARLSSPRAILSDEATIVKIDCNEIKVFDSPFRSEIKPTSFQPSCPLSSIYLLNQSKEIKILPLRKSDAFVQILNKVFYWHHDNNETTKLLKLCKQLAEHIPVYHLFFQKNDMFWGLIS